METVSFDAIWKTRKKPRIKGIAQDARALGVHRNHLLMVIKGRRTSLTLLARYLRLLEARKSTTKKIEL